MPSLTTVFAIAAIVVIILGGSFFAVTFLTTSPKTNTTGASPISTSSHTETRTSSSSTITTSTSTSSSNAAPIYSIHLVQVGSPPLLNSSMHTPMGQTYFPGDGPCCSIPPVNSDIINYSDQGNSWTFQGDLEPGSAYAFANSTGFTINYNTNLNCPRQEQNGSESSTDCAFYGDLKSAPQNGLVFSADAYIPNYNFYSSCKHDSGNTIGCSYEGGTPWDEAALGLDVRGNLVNIGFVEICTGNPCSKALEMIAYASQGGSSCLSPCPLASTIVSSYSPFHRLTIATDRSTFLDMYVDNTLVYSSTTMPLDLSGSGYSLELSERTSINGETFAVTWSNVVIFPSGNVSITGLPGGSSLVVNGTNGFSASQPADANGKAVISVVPEPNNLVISVEMDGKIIATYSGIAQVGSTFRFLNL